MSIQIGDPVPIRDMVNEHVRAVVNAAPSLKQAARILGIREDTLRERRRSLGLRIMKTNTSKK